MHILILQIDHDYSIQDFNPLSMFIENAVVYIAGFVVRTIQKKLMCPACSSALLDDIDTAASTRDHELLDRKNRGGLVTASNDVLAICKVSESIFRQHVGPQGQPPGQTNILVRLTIEILSKLVGGDVFKTLVDHSTETEIVNDHRVLLMKKVASTYLLIRLHHQGKIITRRSQGENCRSVLSKTVLFKGQ